MSHAPRRHTESGRAGRAARALVALLVPCLAVSLLLAGDARRAEHFVKRGLKALEAGELSKAEDQLHRARAAAPTHPYPELLLGQVAMVRGAYDEAETAFLRAIDLHRNLKSNLKREMDFNRQTTQEWLDATRAQLVQEGTQSHGVVDESMMLRRETEADRTESKLEHLPSEIDEDDIKIPADLFLLLGNARMYAGRPAEAVPAYREAILRAPEAPATHHNLAVALARTDALEEALAACRKAEEMGYPPSADLRVRIEAMLSDVAASDPTGLEP